MHKEIRIFHHVTPALRRWFCVHLSDAVGPTSYRPLQMPTVQYSEHTCFSSDQPEWHIFHSYASVLHNHVFHPLNTGIWPHWQWPAAVLQNHECLHVHLSLMFFVPSGQTMLQSKVSSPYTFSNCLWIFPTVLVSHTKNSITASCFWRMSQTAVMFNKQYPCATCRWRMN
jgi:hypothetical protein